MADDNVDCSSLHHQPNLTDICGFVRNTSSCDIDDGFINYTQLLYCTFGALPAWLACIFLFIWWLFLFCGLAVTADDFFCPSLAVIADSLRLSHNVAGVTFLAFGNGAPDIFSAIASIGNAKGGDAGLAIGALFGAGVFVTAVVAGAISIIKPFKSMERPFLRDVIFYLAATYWAWSVMWDKKITQMEAAGFIILYVVYVVVVVAGRYINQKLKSGCGQEMCCVVDRNFADAENDGDTSGVQETGVAKMHRTSSNVQIEESIILLGHTTKRSFKVVHDFLQDINPIVPEEWREKRCHGKMYQIFKSPLVLLLKLTVPVVDTKVEDDPENIRNWNRLLNSVQLFTGPVFGIFVTGVGSHKIGGVFPIYGIVIIVCAIIAVCVYLTSKTDQRPVYHTGFAYLGFLVAVVWIYSIANEIVNILQAFGVVLALSDAILGLTLLAWGNSIGDLIADTTMARQGYPRMGISACFGGPLFNLLLGLGIPFTIACFSNGGTYHLKVTLEEMVLAGGLAFSLASSLVIVTFSKFQMSRPYGIYLLCLYVIFLVIAVLTEVDVIHNFTL